MSSVMAWSPSLLVNEEMCDKRSLLFLIRTQKLILLIHVAQSGGNGCHRVNWSFIITNLSSLKDLLATRTTDIERISLLGKMSHW